MEEGHLESFLMWNGLQRIALSGSILKGKIQNLEDGLQAAFVDIGMKKKCVHSLLGYDSRRCGAIGGRRRSESKAFAQKNAFRRGK